MLSLNLLITVLGPFKTVDLELPGDVPVRELIPILLEICDTPANNPQGTLQANASLQVVGKRAPLSLDRTLAEGDVCDGTVLMLQTEHSPRS